METTTKSVQGLLSMVESGEILLPEIQRRYVWKPAQVAALVDSLYRDYPSGSFLLWKSETEVTEHGNAFSPPLNNPLNRPLYLLDGQQRLTSLHRVVTGHPHAQVVFNVETQKFQNQSAATAKDPHWCLVNEILKPSKVALVNQLAADLPDLTPDIIDERMTRVRSILQYPYHIEIVELPYGEVTEIFVRVNSQGTTLRTVDLALATLSSRWPGVVAKLEACEAFCSKAGFPGLDVGFHTRCLAALSTDTGGLKGFATVEVAKLETGFNQLRGGIDHLLPLLKNNAQIAGSGLLPSTNALIPLVAMLGSRPNSQLSNVEADALIYWLFGAFVTGRYSGSVDTVIAQDVAAVRGADPVRSLLRNLGDFGERLVVSEDTLAGKGASSPYFLFSYLAARRAGARDWWSGIEICTDLAGSFALEYHHIYPRAQLAPLKFSRAEINDLSNLAFISGKANRKISARKPSTYFKELADDDLKRHFIPHVADPPAPSSYLDFLRERRRRLAKAITSLLDSFRPTDLLESATNRPGASVERQVHFDLYGMETGKPETLLITAQAAQETWRVTINYDDLLAFLDDAQSGRACQLEIGEQTALSEPGDETIVIPAGPLNLSGSLEQWRSIIERETADGVLPMDALPSIQEAPPTYSGPTVFPVWDVD